MKNFTQFLILLILMPAFLICPAIAQTAYEILPADPKLERPGKVLAGTAIVRFGNGSGKRSAQGETLAMGAEIGRRMLPASASLSHNKYMFDRAMSSGDNVRSVIRAEEPLLRTYIVHFDKSIAPEIFCRELMKSDPSVEIAEPYYLARAMFVPNDPKAPTQNALAQVKAFDAWEHFKGDTSVVIAISDNGVLQSHPDLAGNIAPNYGEIAGNGVDDDNNGYIDDRTGYNFGHELDGSDPGDTYNPFTEHGTPVAGIAAAGFNNSEGIAGTGAFCRLFPIKVGINTDTDIYFGYESIIYAGVRQFEVLNLSWGLPKTYSDIDQSMVDYAVSRGVAIVAAAGNYTSFPGTSYKTNFYPAAYNGVMGVGEVNGSDAATNSTSLGAHTKIMAPGTGLWITTDQGGYRQEHSGGTSFAAPIVAGALGYARAKYPELGPLEAIEFVRQCTDDIAAKNDAVRDIIPRRLNMQKITETDPMSIPGLKPTALRTKNSDGIYTTRFTSGQDVYLELDLHNYLGPADNLTITLSLSQWNQALRLIDTVQTVASVGSGEDITVGDFSLNIERSDNDINLLRFDIYGEGGYHDYFTMPYTPTTELITFDNGVIKYSVGDFGKFGFAGSKSNRLGVGFAVDEFGNQLYEGGLMATAFDSRVVSAVYGAAKDQSDFASVKPFALPDSNIAIINDSEARSADEIGLEITQEHLIANAPDPYTRIEMSVRNISGKTLREVAVGYYLDWDIMDDADFNLVGSFPEGLPLSMQDGRAAAEFATHEGTDAATVAVGVNTSDPFGVAQAAGLNFDITWDFSKEDQIRALGLGTIWQEAGVNDISMVVGMRFPGNFADGETKHCYFCIVSGQTQDAAAAAMRKCLSEGVNVVERPDDSELRIYPVPADDYFEIGRKHSAGADIQLYDIFGRMVYSQIAESESARINTADLASGIYILRIISGENIISRKVIIRH
ncbi:MAG: S8/S53 family peptidase [Candidatus Kapaibacterium sp.]